MDCVNGHENKGSARFCRDCGELLATSPTKTAGGVGLPAITPVVPSQVEANPAPQPQPTPHPIPRPVPPEAATQQNQAAPPPTGPIEASTPHRRRNIGWLIAILVVTATSTGAYVIGRGSTDDATPIACERGTNWSQAPNPYPDGTLLSMSVPTPRAGVVHAGALIGFSSKAEADAMGAIDFKEIPASEYEALDRRPRQGLLFRERLHAGASGRYFYSAAGTVFMVHNTASLRTFGLDPQSPVVVPDRGFDATAGSPPKSRTLLRLKGSKTTWVIDGGARRIARACRGANIVQLPADPKILDGIPIAQG